MIAKVNILGGALHLDLLAETEADKEILKVYHGAMMSYTQIPTYVLECRTNGGEPKIVGSAQLILAGKITEET